MRFSWVMQDLLLRLGGHGGVKQTKPAEASPLARCDSSSIPTPVQVFTGFGCLPYISGPGGSQADPSVSIGHASARNQVCGARFEDRAHARAGAQRQLVDRTWRDGRDQRKADVDA